MNEFAQFILERLQSMLLLILLAVPLLAGCLLAVYAVCRKKNIPFPWKKLLLWAAMAGYLLILIFATLLRGMEGFREVNLHLFRAWREAWNNYSVKNWLNVLLNVAMFIPLGIFLPMLFVKLQRWYATVGTGLCLSLIVELIQLWRGTGVCDVDDLFANTLGTVIGYAAIMLLVSLFSKKRNWKRCWSCGLTLVLALGGILGIFAAYGLQEYGNIPESASFRADTSHTHWTLKCQLPLTQETAPVYRAQTITKAECDAFGAAFAQTFGITFDDIMYYDKETYFMDHGGEDGAHFLQVSYLDGSYDYRCTTKEDPIWVDADREMVVEALQEYPLLIPNGATFTVDGDGWHSFRIDSLANGGSMFDGILRCRLAADGKVYRVENHLINYSYYGQMKVISPQDAFAKLCAGDFSGGEYFERYMPEEVSVTNAVLEYIIDTKGFYRPIYIFELVSSNGAYRTQVMVTAGK